MGTISTTSQHFAIKNKYEIHLINKYFHRPKVSTYNNFFLSSSHELGAGHHEVPVVVQVLVTGRLDQHGHRVIILPGGDQPEQYVEIGINTDFQENRQTV